MAINTRRSDITKSTQDKKCRSGRETATGKRALTDDSMGTTTLTSISENVVKSRQKLAKKNVNAEVRTYIARNCMYGDECKYHIEDPNKCKKIHDPAPLCPWENFYGKCLRITDGCHWCHVQEEPVQQPDISSAKNPPLESKDETPEVVVEDDTIEILWEEKREETTKESLPVPTSTPEEKAENDQALYDATAAIRMIYLVNPDGEKAHTKVVSQSKLIERSTGLRKVAPQWLDEILKESNRIYSHPEEPISIYSRIRRYCVQNRYKILFRTSVFMALMYAGYNAYQKIKPVVVASEIYQKHIERNDNYRIWTWYNTLSKNYEIVSKFINKDRPNTSLYHMSVRVMYPSRQSKPIPVKPSIPYRKIGGLILSGTLLGLISLKINTVTPTIQTSKTPHIEGWCAATEARYETLSLPQDSPFKYKPPTSFDDCKERLYQVGFKFGTDQAYCPTPCSHNLHVALLTRQLTNPLSTREERKAVYQDGLKKFISKSKDWPTFLSIDKELAMENFLEHFLPVRRGVLRTCYLPENLVSWPAHTRVNAFPKVEMCTAKSPAARDPRCISSPDTESLMTIGPEYYAWQKEVCKTNFSSAISCLSQKYIYTGGLDGVAIGAIVTYYESQGYHCIEGDYSRYDGHTEEEAIEAEFDFYTMMGMTKETLHFFKQQLDTRGGTRTGVRYTVKGKRCSGVINTSLGNTIVGFILAAAMIPDDLFDWVVMQLGDDNVFFIRLKNTHPEYDTDHDLVIGRLLKSMVEIAAKAGHKLVAILRTPFEYDFLEYCSQRFWNIGAQRVLTYKPGRVCSKTFCAVKQQDNMQTYVKDILTGMRYSWFVPVLGVFIKQLASQNPTKKDCYKSHQYSPTISGKLEVDETVIRTQFKRVYGFEAEELEKDLMSLDLGAVGVTYDSELIETLLRVDGAWVDPS